MGTFKLEIVTPERVAYAEEVEMVVAPSKLGTIGVLPHHTPLFAELIEGELKIKKGKEDFFFSIGGGFIEVTPQKTIILVTRALHADELNEQEILEAKKRAEQALKEKPKGAALEATRSLLRSSLVNLKVLRRRRHRPRPTPVPQ